MSPKIPAPPSARLLAETAHENLGVALDGATLELAEEMHGFLRTIRAMDLDAHTRPMTANSWENEDDR